MEEYIEYKVVIFTSIPYAFGFLGFLTRLFFIRLKVTTQVLVQKLRKWIDEASIKILPQGPIGKAMTYCINQWPKLIRCFDDGRLALDNNVIENKIRPRALGRKNYLFAGSHDAAQRIAMMYSMFATCSLHDVNPRDWLTYVIENIQDTKMSELDKLLPQNFGGV
ncbi:MAG: transposase [Saprospiraceae bacterium]